MIETHRQHIGIMKVGALGDILMTTPLVRAIRQQYPQAKITYVCSYQYRNILKGNPNIDAIMTIDGSICTKKKVWKMPSLLYQLFEQQFDQLFVLDKHWAYGLLALFAGVKKRVGFRRGIFQFLSVFVDYKKVQHEIYYYMELGDKAGVFPQGSGIDFFVSTPDLMRGDSICGPASCVAVINSGGDNPGEQGSIRKIPEELFRETVTALAKHYVVMLIGGLNDRLYYEQVLGDSIDDKQVKNIAGTLTLAESAAVMQRCASIITTDCGPMHIASAVHEKIVSVFGPTNPARKAPLHDTSVSIWKDKAFYDERYELNGRIPKRKKFMQTVTADDIMTAMGKLNGTTTG